MESKEIKKNKRFSQRESQKNSEALSHNQFGDRLVSGTERNSSRSLYIELQVIPGKVERLDISQWLDFPGLYQAIAEGAIAAGSGSRYRTREMRYTTLSRGFFTFLRSIPGSHAFVPLDITTFLINRFIKWLDQSNESGTARWQPKSRQIMLTAISSTIAALKRDPKRSEQFRGVVIRKKVWPQIDRSSEPTKTLSDDEWERLFHACVREMKETIRIADHGRALINSNRGNIPQAPYKPAQLKDLGIFLATLRAAYPGVVPYKTKFKEEHPSLCSAATKYHTLRDKAGYLYPTAPQLVAFVLMLAMKTAGNSSQILGTRLADFDEREVLGVRRFTWSSFKERSAAIQVRSTPISDDVDNPYNFVRFLREWSEGIRPEADSSLRDHLFIFGPTGGTPKADQERRPTSFFDSDKSKPSVAWHIELKRFLKRNSLPDLSLQTIRMTSIDRSDAIFGGDIRAKAAIGGQKSVDVIASHYFSGSTKARNEERIGTLIESRNRYRETKGKSDPRKADPGADIGCATPGFNCLDPFSSPVAGQQEGRLCSAYGACPDCPLAQVNISSSYSLGRLLQLRDEIIRAQNYLDTGRWIACWSPRLSALNSKWLPLYQGEAISGLANLQINPIPPVE